MTVVSADAAAGAVAGALRPVLGDLQRAQRIQNERGGGANKIDLRFGERLAMDGSGGRPKELLYTEGQFLRNDGKFEQRAF